MLIPAILMKTEIHDRFKANYYTNDLMYWIGFTGNGMPNIAEEPDSDTFQYAVVNQDNKLLGYISYKVDWYSSCAYNFGVFSFDKGNLLVGRELFNIMNRLIHEYKLHRIEWCMVGGNPVKRSYDRFCQKYNGNIHVLKDSFKDRQGNYHDRFIYEIFPND